MQRVGAERWFHTLVVVGAALGGCMGKTADRPAVGGTSGSGSSGGGGSSNNGGMAPSPTLGGSGAGGIGPRTTTGGVSASPQDCAFDAEFACDDYATRTGCHCDPTAPKDTSECPSQFDFVCTELTCRNLGAELCAGPAWVDCRCDPSRPRPDDCANPEQFYCETSSPHWGDCSCRPDLPVDPNSCRDSYCCQSDDPSFGCGCFCVRIK